MVSRDTKRLLRAGPQECKHLSHAPDRVCMRRGRQRSRLVWRVPDLGSDHAVVQNLPGAQMLHRMPLSINASLRLLGRSLFAIARDNKLFLEQRRGLRVRAHSLDYAIRVLAVIQQQLRVLTRSHLQKGTKIFTVQEALAGFSLDDMCIANYEHLLLEMQSELVRSLKHGGMEALLVGGLNRKQQRLLSWFAEFSDKRRPLSTFPWTIKASLMVLWGVCWMFYPSRAGRLNVPGGDTTRVSQDVLLQNVELPDWGTPSPNDYVNFGLSLTGTQLSRTASQQARRNSRFGVAGDEGVHGGGENRDDLRSRNAAPWYSGGPGSRQASRAATRLDALDMQLALGAGPSSTYCPPPPSGWDQESIASAAATNTSPNATALYYPQHLDPQHQYFDPQSSRQLLQHSLPHAANAWPLTTIPELRVTTTEDYAAPHLDFAAFGTDSIYPPLAQTPQANALQQQQFDSTFSDFLLNDPNIMGGQLPEIPPLHSVVGRHERTSSVNSVTIPTPVSMAGPRSPMTSPAPERRMSIASARGHSRHGSESSAGSRDDDDDVLRRNHAYKRAEEPPRNLDGKMLCRYQECHSLTFDRKCEWSKHMDKHDRPYKCNVKGCEKLQGFTYSGGLLRHEREVHKMHGGTKKALHCPFADCKRSSGSGFTRKENLAEHIRRVHRRTSMSADLGHLIIRRDPTDVNTLGPIRHMSETPFERIPEVNLEDSAFPSLKRKHLPDLLSSDDGDATNLHAEVKRLRRQNEEKDERLRQLEQAVMALQQQGRR